MNSNAITIGTIRNISPGSDYSEKIQGLIQGYRFRDLPAARRDETRRPAGDEALLCRLTAIVESHLSDESFGVGKLAKESGFCRRQLHRKLHYLMNQSPGSFIRMLRLQRAAALIQQNVDTLAGIAYRCGFNTPNYFSKVFRQEFGCTPKEYRQGAALSGCFADRSCTPPFIVSQAMTPKTLSREAQMTTTDMRSAYDASRAIVIEKGVKS